MLIVLLSIQRLLVIDSVLFSTSPERTDSTIISGGVRAKKINKDIFVQGLKEAGFIQECVELIEKVLVQVSLLEITEL